MPSNDPRFPVFKSDGFVNSCQYRVTYQKEPRPKKNVKPISKHATVESLEGPTVH